MTDFTVTDGELLAALDSMTLSVSGWRGIFAASGDEDDPGEAVNPSFLALAALAAGAFADYLRQTLPGRRPVIAAGRDTRPTGKAVAGVLTRVLVSCGVACEDAGVAAIPEIMAYSRRKDGFVYTSASHNPVGHNGFKFGMRGGVLGAKDAARLITLFRDKCGRPGAAQRALSLLEAGSAQNLPDSRLFKRRALKSYLTFTCSTAGVRSGKKPVNAIQKRFAVAADFNGSARCVSIDRALFRSLGLEFFTMNGAAGEIAHGIIPEGENLCPAARFLEELRAGACARFPGRHENVALAYVCDCDGDRGNIVYYDEAEARAKSLSAQEVFALSALSELSLMPLRQKKAVACNGPTSMRLDEIATVFGARVFRAEVGEANVVALAQKLRRRGYTVRISGEGSNGGSITYPARVRDPLNTVIAALKLLSGGGFRKWCELSGRSLKTRAPFTLSDVIKTLPAYTTTGVTEARAMLRLREKNPVLLKQRFQAGFEAWWKEQRVFLAREYGIASYTAIATNAAAERGVSGFGQSGAGGLKILFRAGDNTPLAFMWMRNSGTENVFRVLCDSKAPSLEPLLLQAERSLLLAADSP
jgi:phosphoglucomutase